MKNVYVHLGMPKSATTTFQNDIFPNMRNTYYTHSNDALSLILTKALSLNKLIFERYIKEYTNIVDNFIDRVKEDNIIISNESLIGNYKNNFMNMEYNFFIIKTLFPEAKIIITIRKQSSILESMYKQILHEGYSTSISSFLNYEDDKFQVTNSQTIGLSVYSINYNHIMSTINNYFINSHIIVFEEFITEPDKCLSKLYEFFKIEPKIGTGLSVTNKGYGLISAYVALILNRFLVREYNSCGFIIEKPFYKFFHNNYKKTLVSTIITKIIVRLTLRKFLQNVLDNIYYIKYKPITKKMNKQIFDIHKDSNEQLNNLVDSDLSKYGYM